MIISVQGIAKQLGKRELFRDVSFHIGGGERVGLIGANGAGKTTLFHVLTGETEPDEGQVTRPKSVRVGYLPQDIPRLSGKAVLSHMLEVDSDLAAARKALREVERALGDSPAPAEAEELALRHAGLLERVEHLGGYDLDSRARKILSGLGFRDAWLSRPVSELSGGWAMRLSLARLLLSEPDLLLLDEPTNHLDLESLLWLEEYLLSSRSAMVVVSHDRAFLNRVVVRVLEIEQGRLADFPGDYDAYVEEKARRQMIQLSTFRNQQERIRQIERFVERNRVRASGARQAQSRLKMLERMERVEAPEGPANTIEFAFPEPERTVRRVLELAGVSKSYGETVVYRGLDLVIERGDRVAFLGANGAGKTTLLKVLAGVEPVSSGKRAVGQKVTLGYYAQNLWEQLNPKLTVLEEARGVAGDMGNSRLRALLGAFLFPGEDAEKRVSVLSGGEKARLTLAKLLLSRPNVLLLDEPTNHLDIPSRDVLERALSEFTGTICFISHDRHFINAVATKVLAVRGGAAHLLPGNYDDYDAVWRPRLDESEAGEAASGASASAARCAPRPPLSPQERKRAEAEARNELHRLRKPLAERVATAEAALERAQGELFAVEGRLSDTSTYQDGARVRDLHQEYARLKREVESLEGEWEESSLALEEFETTFRKERLGRDEDATERPDA